MRGGAEIIMKKILSSFFVLSLTISSVFGINPDTQISWNSAVVEGALYEAGISRSEKWFKEIVKDLLQRPTFSVSDAVRVCKRFGVDKQDESSVSSICEEFGQSLVVQNNRLADMLNAPNYSKENCDNTPGWIWLEYYKVCVPQDVCIQDGGFVERTAFRALTKDYIEYQQWCIRDFSNVQVRHVKYAENLATSYLENIIGKNAGVDCRVEVPGAGDKRSVTGDNYIPCVTKDGRYFVFEFDDTTQTFAGTPKYAFQGLCKSFGGNARGDVCVGLSESQCNTIGKQLDPNFVGDDDTEYNKITGECKWD